MTEEVSTPITLECGPTLVKICEELAVNPDHVATVKREARQVLVRMKDGEVHGVYPNYGETAFQAFDRLLGVINA